MKYFILPFLIFAINNYSIGQGSYNISGDGKITNFYKQTDFHNFCEVDFDFNKASNCMQVTTSVIFDVNSKGTGSFHLFVEKKTSYKVISCYKKGNSLQFNLENSSGTQFKAALFLNNNSIDKFYFQSIYDNTGYMLY
jgi:hypothetical protein